MSLGYWRCIRGAMLVLALAAWPLGLGCDGGSINPIVGDDDGGPPPDPCKKGGDVDGDGYGTGCDKGNDCNDSDPLIHPGAKEICDGTDNNCNGQKDEGVTNACGTCSQTCAAVGKGQPFPTDPTKDPNVKDVKGVGLDANGDLVLKKEAVNFNYMWISNTYDAAGSSYCSSSPSNQALCRGTVSKVDTDSMKEVARYFSVTCFSQGNTTGCTDINGKTIDRDHVHTPSRTAVDYNFDVWVANRSVHGGQPSATKIANDTLDCVDRNKNNVIDTSKDQDGDGKITLDCDGDSKADGISTKCKNGKPPEFLGDDDECIIMTVNFSDKDDIGRSICLDMGKGMVGASNAWVGTFYRPEKGRGKNKFYKINGMTGKIEATVDLPDGHHSYGCTADAHNIIWSTDIYGSMAYFQSTSPYSVGAKLVAPWVPKTGKTYHHYGIAVDGTSNIWLGGYHSAWVLRYRPKRDSFAGLGTGTWTRVDVNDNYVTRGIAVDARGFVWVAIQDGGYILQIAQNIPDGIHDRKNTKNIWPVKADTVIGVGVDFKGNVWAVGHKNNIAARLDVDSSGNVTSTGMSKYVTIGQNPYTYSDFTGYGLMNFVRPSGRYVYQLNPCPSGVKANWKQVSWSATVPATTAIAVRVRTGDSETTFGSWSNAFSTSPADIDKTSSTPISPNPSYYIQVEFTLSNKDKVTSPILHDFGVSYSCYNVPG